MSWDTLTETVISHLTESDASLIAHNWQMENQNCKLNRTKQMANKNSDKELLPKHTSVQEIKKQTSGTKKNLQTINNTKKKVLSGTESNLV